jgi:ABC-type uncharacterized transport system fused permease/ATPase subunit
VVLTNYTWYIMQSVLPKGWGLTTTMMVDAVKFNLRALTNDKPFCFFLAASAVGVGSTLSLTVKRLATKQKKMKSLREKMEAAKNNNSKTSKDQVTKYNKKNKKNNKKKKKRRNQELGSKFWSRLYKMLRLAVPTWKSESFRMLIVQFSFLVLRALLTVRLSQINVQLLTSAISNASWAKWARWLVNMLGWTAIGISVNSGLHFVEHCLRLSLRRELTIRAHELYMRNNFFYHANVMQSGVALDNLDQRIASDIYEFCFEVVGLYGHSFKPLLEFLLSISVAMNDIGAKRPLAMFGWFFVVGGMISVASPRIGAVVAERQEAEGEFRRVHTRLIAHAEEIAFLRGSDAEKALLNSRFDDMVTQYGSHNLKYLAKKVFDELLKFQAPLVGGIAVHIPFLLKSNINAAERITKFRSTETIMLKSGSAFGETMLLHKRFQRVSGFTKRIAELFEALEKVEDGSNTSKMTQASRANAEKLIESRIVGDRIEFIHLTVAAPEPTSSFGSPDEDDDDDNNARTSSRPSKRLLVKDLNLSIPPGKNVMVTGPNGCGKTSLFRVLAGLWPAESGTVIAPRTNVMWLPQRPYLVLGNLRDQVTYPLQFREGREEAVASGGGCGRVISQEEDRRIVLCLRKAGLDRFVDQEQGLELTHHEWNTVLSGGERQRLGFARLFYGRPQYAVLDESTSALNPEIEKELYTEIASSTDVTVISIAHRMALSKYHDYKLQIIGDGSGDWKIEKLQEREKSGVADNRSNGAKSV